MPQGGKQTDVGPGLIARAVQGARYAISGVTPASWFGPMQPLQPVAPAGVAGRRYDCPTGANLDTRPRGYEPIGFDDLRFMADNCDILRSVIETRKDQMEGMEWTIRPRFTGGSKAQTAATDDQKKRIDQITAFFQSPDRVNNWPQWQRQLLEERFVTDAACLYKRRDRKGRLFALTPIDGATIKILLDDHGQRPAPPDPAYQQILKGVPAVDYTADEVMYLMRNPRVWKAYGYSEVEQIIVTVNIAIRRALFQLEYYREGSIPDAFGTLPADWSVDQIKGFSDWFQSQVSGQLGERRKLKFMPDGFKYQETKQPPLKDMYDEWLARIICFVFSISPEPFVQHTNKGTAETAHDRAVQEGLQPMQRWIKGIVDPIITLEFDSADLEFTWQDDREQDPMQAATIRQNDVKVGLISIDEGREDMGLDPIGGACAVPMALTPQGYVVIDPEARAAMTPTPAPFGQGAKPGEAPGAEDDGEASAGKIPPGKISAPKKTKDEPSLTEPAKKSAYARLGKAAAVKPVPFDREATRAARKSLERAVAGVLEDAGKKAARRYRLGKLAKSDDDGLDLSGLMALIDVVPDALESVAADSGRLALAQVGVGDRSGLVDQVNARAVEYARRRAAEMVGRKYDGDGVLADNPDAEWRIDEATRDELQSIISRGLEDNIGRDAIADAIRDAAAFSGDRAELIASTEVARANSVGALNGYKTARDAGVKVKKIWLPDSDPCPICQDNADQGAIGLDDDFDSGDDAPPAHCNCECTLIPVVEDDNGNETEEDE